MNFLKPLLVNVGSMVLGLLVYDAIRKKIDKQEETSED